MVSVLDLDHIALNKGAILGQKLNKDNYLDDIDRIVGDWIIKWRPISSTGKLGNLLIRPKSRRASRIYDKGQIKFYMDTAGVTLEQAEILKDIHVQYKHEAVGKLKKILVNPTLTRLWQCYPLIGSGRNNWKLRVAQLGYIKSASMSAAREEAIALCVTKITKIDYFKLLNPKSPHYINADIKTVKDNLSIYDPDDRQWPMHRLPLLPVEFSWLSKTQLMELKTAWEKVPYP